MKLNLGENLRGLRRASGMTQEQLADRMGVSYQAVSRWENGTTYPDLEFIPALANIFEVTTDSLLGVPDRKREAEAEEVFRQLAQATYEKTVNTETVNGLIRRIRRDYLRSKHFYHFWLSVNLQAYRMPEILPEVRSTVETILEGGYDMWEKGEAIRYFSCVEADERVEGFLDKYASKEDMSKNTLLYHRYQREGSEAEKGKLLRQEIIREQIDRLIQYGSMSNFWGVSEDYEALHAENRICLKLLHDVCGVIPDEKHPISGNGELDLWIEPRLGLGLHEIYFLAREGETERALLVLEDVVGLLEKAMQITEATELRCTSPWLEDIVWTAEEAWGQSDGSGLLQAEEERMLYLYNKDFTCYCVYPSVYYEMLTDREGKKPYTKFAHCLESIWDRAEYKVLTERIRAMIVVRRIED